MKRLLALSVATILAGCAPDAAPVVTMVEPAPVSLPSECTSGDPAWVNLPDKDVKRSEAAKNYDTNKRQYNRVLARRSVCRAAITAAQKG